VSRALLEHARAKLLRWRERPIEMVVEEFRVEPQVWQADVLTAFAAPDVQRIAMKACKGPGKTAVEAWCILNFLVTRPSPKIICTSITEGNLNTNLWPELAKWIGMSQFFREVLEWTKTRVALREDPENWFAVARSWPKQADPEAQANALAGVHADYVMAVADESGGYPQAVMTTLEAVLSSCIEGKVIQGGNPTHTTGPLYRACTIDKALWTVVTITGDPDDPKRSPRVGLKWAREEIARYGRENPWVMVNVLGQFPPSSINALLGVEDVDKAMKVHLRTDEYDHMQKRLGVDVARFGDDRSVIFPRQGLASFKPVIMRHQRTTSIAARTFEASRRWGAELIFVDDTGHWGHGVIDNLVVAGAPVHPVIYNDKAIDPRYKNRRAEFWMKGADAIKAGAALPPIPDMVGELTEPTYTFLNGVFQLEEKAQVKARLGRSPDLADAYFQTYALEDLPGEMVQKLRGRAHATTEFDPYALRVEADRAAVDFDPFDPIR